jgi:hypothetical protein
MDILLTIVLALGLVGAADPEWSDYKPASLLKAFSEAVIVEGSDRTIEAGNVKYVVEGLYAGEHRDLIAGRVDLFRAWAQSLGHPERATLCAHEILVQGGKQTYWLPLQNTLLEPFAQEAKQGARLRLHIMYIGAVGKDRVFMVNRFEVLSQ